MNLLSALAKAQLPHKASVSPNQNGLLFLQALPNQYLAMPLSEAAGTGSTHMPPALRDSHRAQQCLNMGLIHQCHTASSLGSSRLQVKASEFQGILTLVDGCWKALEENTTVRTVNDLYTVGKTDLEHAS